MYSNEYLILSLSDGSSNPSLAVPPTGVGKSKFIDSQLALIKAPLLYPKKGPESGLGCRNFRRVQCSGSDYKRHEVDIGWREGKAEHEK